MQTTPQTKHAGGHPVQSAVIPIEAMLTLACQGHSHQEIANALNCDKSNVSNRLKPYADKIIGLQTFKRSKATFLLQKQYDIVNSISPEDIKKANLGTKVTAAAILEDKIRLIEGKTTSNIGLIAASISIDADIARLKQELEDASG